MIDKKKLAAVKTIVTHKDCADGTASAILLHDALPEARVLFMQHNTPELAALKAEPGMLFCDFAPPRERAQEFVDAGTIVLDHHKTAKDVVAMFGKSAVFGDELDEPGVSGAVLAYRHVWRPLREQPREKPFGERDWNTETTMNAARFAELAGIRDTWQRDSPHWTEACEQAEMLRFFPWSEWAEFFGNRCIFVPMAGLLHERMRFGRLLVAKHAERVDRALASAYRFTTGKGTNVVAFQGLDLTSDAAEKLGDGPDLVVGFGFTVDHTGDRQTPRAIFSTRSHTAFDCAAFAKHFGGGGHTKAAGFSLLLLDPDTGSAAAWQPYVLLETLLGRWEDTRR